MQYIQFDALAAPPMIALMIGDAAHNLRSALDHVAGEIKRDAGGDDTRGHFPISDTRVALETSVSTQIEPFDPRVAKTILDKINSSDARNNFIRSINKLDNIDKHRRLTLAVTTTGLIAENITLPDGSTIGRLKTQDTLIPIMVMGGGQIHFEKDFEPTVSVVFGEGEGFEGEPVIPTLTEAAEFFTEIIRLCEEART